MAKITACVTDKVPTVQYGSVSIGPITISRYIDDLGDGLEGRQHRIDRARELEKDAEYVCGIERRLLQWAVDPASRIQSPVSGQEAFAAPPDGYDPTKAIDVRQLEPVPGSPPPPSAAEHGEILADAEKPPPVQLG